MAKEVFMPKAGMDMQEGRIIRWLAEVGGAVRLGEPLLEIETDKVTMEVESPADGILLCKYFDEGAVVPVVTIIGYVGEAGERVPERPAMAGGSTRAIEQERLVDRELAAGREREYEYRVAVIGGGPAGYTAALRAAQSGKKTILFEKELIGGTGVNSGSIPMKCYMRTARMLEDMERAADRGIITGGVRLDTAKAAAHMRGVVSGYRERIERLLQEAGVEVVREEASMMGRHHIRAGQRMYRAENTILCCGSTPRRLDVPGADQKEIIDTNRIFEMETFPERIAIIGGGVIGCETASALSRFGSRVAIIEIQDQLLPTFDREIAEEVRSALVRRGVEVITGGKVECFERNGDCPVVALASGARIEADIVMLAVGRQPRLDCLGTLAEEIDYERGKIMVDEYCRTNLDDVYACGDITNRSILAHSAMKMGDAAASTACGSPKLVRLNRAPLCLYTLPEAAGIGLTEAQARKQGEILIGKFPFAANARAAASGETEGFVKVIADKGYGEILGVHIVGAYATELIVEAKTMMDMEITVYEVADIMHPHPTWSEAFMEACADAIGGGLA